MAKASKRSQVNFWFCVQIEERYNKPLYYREIHDALSKVFNGTAEIRVIGRLLGESLQENSVEDYVFICHPDYKSYIDEVRRLKYVSCVFCSSGRTPATFTQEEIDKLTLSCQAKESHFNFGDIILVEAGVYSHLHGIVIEELANSKDLKTLFKLNESCFTAEIKPENASLQGNIFTKVKLPL